MQMHSHSSKIDLYIFSRRIAEIGTERNRYKSKVQYSLKWKKENLKSTYYKPESMS